MCVARLTKLYSARGHNGRIGEANMARAVYQVFRNNLLERRNPVAKDVVLKGCLRSGVRVLLP